MDLNQPPDPDAVAAGLASSGVTVLTADDSGYDEARRVYNGLIDRRPVAIIQPTSASEIQHALDVAAQWGDLPISVKSGGHHPAGFAVVDRGLMIDLCRLNHIAVDAVNKTARIGAGALMGDVNRTTVPLGLAAVGGTYPTVGVGGLVLCGGWNFLARAYGLACDNLRSATLVTAAGEIVAVDEENEPALLWGLRGAGPNFGVIAELEVHLHPIPAAIQAGWLIHDLNNAQTVLGFLDEFMRTAPDHLWLDVEIFTVGPGLGLPSELEGRRLLGITVVSLANKKETDANLAPLRDCCASLADTVDETTYGELAIRREEPYGRKAYWQGEHLPRLSERLVDGLVDLAGEMPDPGQIFLMPIGGAPSRCGQEHACYGARQPGWLVQAEMTWGDNCADDELVSWVQQAHREVLAPGGLGFAYMNASIDESGPRIRASFGDEAYARLRTLKQRWDPDNRFRMNLNVDP